MTSLTPPRSPLRRQRGNAMIMALFALLLAGATALAAFQNRQIEIKRQAGLAEATVLDALRVGAHNLVEEFMFDIQAGNPITKNSVTITPVAGTWRITPQQLATMEYLPSGWTTNTSALNGANYVISWRLVSTPACTPTATCNIQGTVVLDRPITDPNDPTGTTDAFVIGPILTRLGVDGGMSLPTGSPPASVITGYDSTWTVPNPSPGTPGIVAVRFGTASSLMTNFVRIGDIRNPNLAGPLTVAGATTFNSTTTLNGATTVNGLTTLNGPAQLNAGADVRGGMQLKDDLGNNCVTITKDGVVSINCTGQLNATQATFGAGATTSSITGTEITTSGRLEGQRLQLNEVAVEGAPCTVTGTGGNYAQLSGGAGGLAVCAGGTWAALNRLATTGDGCTREGAIASDPADAQSLICRNGVYMRASALLSNFVLMETVRVPMTATGPSFLDKPVCPTGNGSSNPALAPEPLLLLTGNIEAHPVSIVNNPVTGDSVVISGINRYAEDFGNQWRIHLERSVDNAPLDGMLMASTYCFYK